MTWKVIGQILCLTFKQTSLIAFFFFLYWQISNVAKALGSLLVSGVTEAQRFPTAPQHYKTLLPKPVGNKEHCPLRKASSVDRSSSFNGTIPSEAKTDANLRESLLAAAPNSAQNRWTGSFSEKQNKGSGLFSK